MKTLTILFASALLTLSAQDAKPLPLPDAQAIDLLMARMSNAQLAAENAALKLRSEQEKIPAEYAVIKARVCAAQSIPMVECQVDAEKKTVAQIKASPAPSISLPTGAGGAPPPTNAAAKPAGKE